MENNSEGRSETLATILEKPPSFLSQAFFYILLIAVIAGIAWASFAKLDVVIPGKGNLTNYGLSKIVQSETSGVIDKLLVKEGQRVRESEILIRLDTTRSRASLEKIKQQLNLQEESLKFSSLEIEAAQTELERSAKEYELQKQMAAEGLAPQVKTLDYERKMDDAKNRLEAARLKKISIKKTMEQLDGDLLIENRNQRSFDIRAPVGGIITELKVRGSQEFVQPGQIVATIAQETVPLVARVLVASKDSGHLKMGLPAKIKVDSYPFQDYGALKGQVILVSADVRVNEKDGSAFYEVIVGLDGDTLKFRGREVRVKRGQNVIAELIVDRMPLIWVVLKPIRQLKGKWTIAPD